MESNLKSGALNVAITAARNAGNIINQNIEKLDRIKVSQKSVAEFVSEVDTLAEQTIINEIEKHFPEHNIIGEESGDLAKESDICWIIDPLDGTHNFLHGNPHCCVSIAIKEGDQIELAVIYDPFRNELFSATKGAGAQLDGRRIRVSEKGKLSEGLLITGFPYSQGPEVKPWLKTFAAILPRAESVQRTGSSALDFAWLACGRYDGLWEFGMKQWDIAAGSLLVSEAGGMISDMHGGKNVFSSGDVVAGNPKIYEKLKSLVDHCIK